MTIHATAVIAAGAQVPPDVEIGAFTIVHKSVEIGAGAVIGSNCELGLPTDLAEHQPLRIGTGSLIRSHSVLYQGSTLGPDLETGHHVTIRERTVAGRNLRVGTLSDVQGDCTFGDFVRLHSKVFVAKLTTIESFAWAFPSVVFANDRYPPSDRYLAGPHIEEYAVVGAMSTVLPGVRVGRHAVVAAQSLVSRDIAPGMLARGVPAKEIRAATEIADPDTGEQIYPWTRRFHRGYPDDVVALWGD